MKRNPRIGIFGGTFNPPHLGHLIMAESALRQLKLDKVVFIPAFLPPHKKVKNNNSRARYKMTVLACKGNPAFEVSPVEINRKSVSYSVDTLRVFRKRYGDKAELFFIIGSDSLNELSTWKESGELSKMACFVTAPRQGFPVKSGIKTITMPFIDISASDIRRRAKKSLSIRYLVPEAVRGFIEKSRLYKF